MQSIVPHKKLSYIFQAEKEQNFWPRFLRRIETFYCSKDIFNEKISELEIIRSNI
jgi:hypothetical protein